MAKQTSLFFSSLLFAVSLPTVAFANDKVGVLLPLSGDFGYFGEEVRQGMTIASEELKAKGATVPELIFEDEKCLAKDAVSAYRRLVNESAVGFFIGPACSTSIQSIAPIAQKSSEPVLFLLDSGARVAAFADPLYSFGFDPQRMASMLADDMQKRKIDSVAVMSEDEEYALLVSKAFEAHWKQLGGKVAVHETVPINSTDLRTVFARTLARKPGAIFYSSAYSAGNFLKELRVAAPDIPVYGNDTMCISDTIDAAKSAAEGARCGNVVLDESAPEVIAFRAAIEKKYGKAPASLFYEALGYDAVRLAIKEMTGKSAPGKSMLGVEERSATGMYDVTPTVLEIRGGKMTPVD